MRQANQINVKHLTKRKLKRTLVVEPSEINWIGLRHLLGNLDGTQQNILRVSELIEAKNKIYEFQPDVILFTPLPHRTDYLLFLSFLSDIVSYYPVIYSVIWLQHDMRWMVPLFHAFGVVTLLIDPVSIDDINHCLGAETTGKVSKREYLLGKQERVIALALLRGGSVTAIAHMMKKDVRTISTQKKSIIKKLGMKTNEELYLLAGRLVYLSKVNQ